MFMFTRRLMPAGVLSAMFLSAMLFSSAIISPVAANRQVVIHMTASIVKKAPDGKFTGGWDPRRITVSQGDEVTIRIHSVDVEHMFTLEAYNIAADVVPGKPVEVRFTADKAGVFYYHCGIECGPYHRKMVGQIIVNPKSSQ